MSWQLSSFLKEYESNIKERRRQEYLTGQHIPIPLRGDNNKLTIGDLYFITYNFPDLTTTKERQLIDMWYEIANKNKRGRSYYFFIEASCTTDNENIHEASLRDFPYYYISNEDYGYAELNGDRVVYCLQIKSRILRSESLVDIQDEFSSLLDYASDVLYEGHVLDNGERVRFKEYSPPINLFELFEISNKVWSLYHNKRDLYIYKRNLFSILPKTLSLFPYVLDNILVFLVKDECFVRKNKKRC